MEMVPWGRQVDNGQQGVVYPMGLPPNNKGVSVVGFRYDSKRSRIMLTGKLNVNNLPSVDKIKANYAAAA